MTDFWLRPTTGTSIISVWCYQIVTAFADWRAEQTAKRALVRAQKQAEEARTETIKAIIGDAAYRQCQGNYSQYSHRLRDVFPD